MWWPDRFISWFIASLETWENMSDIWKNINKAFLQKSLKEKNYRHVLEFLWISKEGKVRVYRQASVGFVVTCSPFLLASVIDKLLEKTLSAVIDRELPYQEATIKKLVTIFNVDNFITSVSPSD